MRTDLRTVAGQEFDLLVAGGGIHGVAIAREAALRGARVLLAEREDFGAGTSSASSRLIHGGVRYLQQGRIRLVREALAERERLLRLAPHLVRPLPMLMPFFADGPGGRRRVRFGLWLYRLLARGSTLPPARSHGPADCRRLFPALRQRDLLGGVLFFDAVTEDQRLVLAVALAAATAGARLCNHVEVAGARSGRVLLRDVLAGHEVEVTAKQLVNATGAAVDPLRRRFGIDAPPLVRTTRGSHLVLDPLPWETALAAFLPDRRIQFVVPHRDGTICGTTDVDDPYDERGAYVPDSDRQYLRDALQYLLEPPIPAVRHEYAGWRALPNVGGLPGRIGREALLVTEPTAAGPLHSVVGGKLTTHRALAERAVARWLGDRSPSRSRVEPLPGGSGPADVEDPLWWRYGSLATEVRAMASGPDDLRPIGTARDFLRVEVRYAIRRLGAVTFPDLMLRRLFHSQGPDLEPETLRAVHALFVRERGASPAASFEADQRELFARLRRQSDGVGADARA